MNVRFITGVLKKFTLASALITVPFLPFSQLEEIKTVSATTVSPYSFMKAAPPAKISTVHLFSVDATLSSAEFISPPTSDTRVETMNRSSGDFYANYPISSVNQSSTNVQQTIINAALRYGQDPSVALRVARCESGFNIYAHNPSGATGLFQFMPRTFYGNGGKNLYDSADQSDVAMRMWSHGQKYQWSCQ